MKIGYIKKDRQQRYNVKRGWFVNAWRIVDESGADMVQPWMRSKGEAKRLACQLGIELKGERNDNQTYAGALEP